MPGESARDQQRWRLEHISRFFDKYETWDPKSKTKWPRQGDMYYMPDHPNFGKIHRAGFVHGINSQFDWMTISTIDGNDGSSPPR